MHLYNSWRKLKNCIVKMILHSATKANKDIFLLSTVYVWVDKGRKARLMCMDKAAPSITSPCPQPLSTHCAPSEPLAAGSHNSGFIYNFPQYRKRVWIHLSFLPLSETQMCMYTYACACKTFTPTTLEFSIKMMLKHIIRAYFSIWNWLDFPLTAAVSILIK